MYNSSDLRKGLKVEVDNDPWEITDFDFCKPGKGTALYRCKLKNMITGTTMDRTWRPSDKVGKPNLEDREYTYMYYDNTNYIFSDNENYEELHLSPDKLGDQKYFLIENDPVKILFFNSTPIDIELPIFIEKEIVFTEPAVRGDTSTGVTKEAKLDNGYLIQVPGFINEGDTIKIDTRTGLYNERLSKA